jgi:hypothetical protein
MPKMRMWVTSFRNIPHAGQDTNAAVESYHANMKSILSEARQKFQGRRMDWLIYELTGDVHTHYWYAVQCKLYGFVANRNAERIVASAVLRARGIPDHLIRLFPGGQDIAQVMSINHYPQVYTILAPGEEWAQYNCPWADRGNICKHAVKVFQLIHSDVRETDLIRQKGTWRGTPAARFDTSGVDAFGGGESHVQESKNTYKTGPTVTETDNVAALHALHEEIEELVRENPDLLLHALYHARRSKGKILDRIAQSIILFHKVFSDQISDCTLKQIPGMLERK